MLAGYFLNPPPKTPGEMPARWFWAATGGMFVLAGILLFTWFGRDWTALVDLMRAIPRFAARAGGEGHQKPFWYFGWLLNQTPALLILAGIGAVLVARRLVQRREPARGFMLVYGLLVVLIYSAIPYKTPWLALNLLLPLALLCGFTVEFVWNQVRGSLAGWLVLVAVWLAWVGWLAYDLNRQVYHNAADEANPYAYAHTGEDVLGVPEQIRNQAQQRQLAAPRIAVVAADAWPLPWYLRQFSQTGFWQPGQDPGAADFIITTTEVPANLAARLKTWRADYYGVRPGVLLMVWTPPTNPAAHE